MFRSNESCLSDFLYYSLANEDFITYVMASAKGVKMPRGDKQQMQHYSIYLPSICEQQKIADFLTLIDERIGKSRKIIEGLQSYKSAVSKKIFSQELRFKNNKRENFPEWKNTKMGEVLSIPEKNKPNNIDKGKLLTVKLHMKGVCKNENTDGLSIGSTSYYIRKQGQFIYGKQNLFNGAFGIVPVEFDGFLSSGDVPSLDVNSSKLSNIFLFYFFGRENFYKKLEDIASGSGSKRIHEETLLKVEIQIPSLSEQLKIASFLYSLDNKIDLETAFLQQLKLQKQYLLQQLFI